jgi:hypothetical protein
MPLFRQRKPSIKVAGCGGETLTSTNTFWLGDHLPRGITTVEGSRDIKIIGDWTITALRLSQRSQVVATGTNANTAIPLNLKNRTTGTLYTSLVSFSANSQTPDNQVITGLNIPVVDNQNISFYFTVPNYTGVGGTDPTGWTAMIDIYMI